MQQAVTIREVARRAGVHHSVAGAVLNGAKGNTRVGDATRSRVEAVAQQLGYQVNETAQSLRRGSSANVCLAGGDLRNPFFAELAAKLERELSQSELRLLITHVARPHESRDEIIAALLARQTIRTLIYWEECVSSSPSPHPESPPGASPRLLPIGYSILPRAGIWLDLRRGMHLAVEALSVAGKRRLGFYYPGSDLESPSVAVRRDAFIEECVRAGLPEPRTVAFPGDACHLAGAAGRAGHTLRTHPEVEGWLGFNDVASLGLLMGRAGRPNPPEVFCFDGTELTRNWPGSPPSLDLRLDALVSECVKWVAKDTPPARPRIIRPRLTQTRTTKSAP